MAFLFVASVFYLLYIALNPGFPVYQTVPADDMQIDTPNLHVRKKSWQIPRLTAQFVPRMAFNPSLSVQLQALLRLTLLLVLT